MLQIFKTLKMFFTQTGEFPILNVAISSLQVATTNWFKIKFLTIICFNFETMKWGLCHKLKEIEFLSHMKFF